MKLAATLLLLLGCSAATWAQSPRQVKWLAEVQTSPKSLPENTPSLRALWEKPPSRDEWVKQREAIRQQWLEFLGPLASAERGLAPKLTVLKEDRVDGVVRQLVEYEVEQGEKTQAYLLKPEKLSGKTAGVVVFHSTVNHSILQPAGLGSDAEKAFGLRLAKQGYVTFCPRNFLWPTNDKLAANEETERFKKRHGDSKGMAKMLYDALVAVDILAAQPEVDANRLGSIGHSLGAKEVLYLAAFDDRVKVTISSEGGIGTAFSNWEAPWYLSQIIHGNAFTSEHHELLALVAPRPFLLVGGDSADGDRSWPFIAATLPVYRLYDEKSQPLGLFNHKQGHAVPPEELQRIDDWFAAYLPPGDEKE